MTLPSDIEDQSPTLRDLLDRGPLPIGLALEIARQILQAPDDLQALSPENLVLVQSFDGAPVVEKIGNLEPLEAPSGIYAFGVLLYELLTAVHPFQGHTSSVPLSFQVSDRQRRLPPELRVIVLTAIAEDPEGRFASAEALAAELAKIQERYPLEEATYETPIAPRPVRGTRLPAYLQRTSSRGILPRLLALFTVLALLLLLWALLDRQEEPERPAVAAQADLPEVDLLEAQAPAALPETAERPKPAQQTQAREPRQAAIRQRPAPRPRTSPAKAETRMAGGRELFESESAVPLSAPAPRYPEAALGTDTWAEVVVGLTIDETGAVRNPTIERLKIQGSAPAALFQEAALAAAREARYRPAREQGSPVRSWSTLTFTFGSR